MTVSGQFKQLTAALAFSALLLFGCGDKGTGSGRDGDSGGGDPSGSTYTVTFNANGGTGTAPAKQTVNAGTAITLPGGNGLTKNGYAFGGWNTNNSGTGTNYSAGGSYTPTRNTTLYAKWNSDSSGGKDDPPDTLNVDILVVDISSETSDWNYVAVGKDGSSMFIDVDESTDMPARVYIKPDKNSDSGATIFFKENGLPDKMVVGGHILYYGNFTGNKYDLAVIYPDNRIEYHFGIESDVNWDDYGSMSGLSKSQRLLDWKDVLANLGRSIITCVATYLVPNVFTGKICAASVTQTVVSAINVMLGDDVAEGVGIIIDAFGCANGDMMSCVLTVAGTINLISIMDSDLTDEKYEQMKEAAKMIYGDDGVVIAYFVAFNANGGSGAAPNIRAVESGSRTTLPEQGNLTRSGYNFNGWNTNSSGTGTNYSAGGSYTPTRNITLYARWTSTVRFDGNNGIIGGVAPSAVTVIDGFGITLPGQGGMTKNGYGGYRLAAWNTNASGTGEDYDTGSVYTPTGNITLYGRWVHECSGWVRGSQLNPNTNYTSFTDSRDGKSYMKVKIGAQTWMAENLDYDVSGSTKDVCYDNYDGCCAKYGRLYSLYDAQGGTNDNYVEVLTNIINGIAIQGVCPAGWHLPSGTEWDALENFIGGSETAGKYLKSLTGWYNRDGEPAGNGTDAYGFSALPGGYSATNSTLVGLGINAGVSGFWWNVGGVRYMYYDYDQSLMTETINTSSGLLSVRCVADGNAP